MKTGQISEKLLKKVMKKKKKKDLNQIRRNIMSNETIQEMENILKLQKKLYVEEGIPSLELRQDRLSDSRNDRKYHKEIFEAITADFGSRRFQEQASCQK